MSTQLDYRTLPLKIHCVADSGKYIGKRPYWRLYVIENTFRIIIHSVLLIQLGPNWLSKVIDPKKYQQLQDRKRDYISQPQHSFPGNHDIYFLFLPDLSRIMLEKSHLFIPAIPDINNWVIRLESIRLPRNVVGHMNWLIPQDIQEIDTLYLDIKNLYRRLERSNLQLIVP